MNTKQIGDITESIIISELMKKGYKVLRPFGDNEKYDLVVDNGNSFVKIQCKTARESNGCVAFNTFSVYSGEGKRLIKKSYLPTDIDYFMVYSSWTDKVYIVDVNVCVKGEMKLRVNIPRVKGNQTDRIKWARDYEFNGLPETREAVD